MWRVVCNQEDTPGTLYDEKWKADRVARVHARNNRNHTVKVQRISTQISIESEYTV